jgi:hypothetical protein
VKVAQPKSPVQRGSTDVQGRGRGRPFQVGVRHRPEAREQRQDEDRDQDPVGVEQVVLSRHQQEGDQREHAAGLHEEAQEAARPTRLRVMDGVRDDRNVGGAGDVDRCHGEGEADHDRRQRARHPHEDEAEDDAQRPGHQDRLAAPPAAVKPVGVVPDQRRDDHGQEAADAGGDPRHQVLGVVARDRLADLDLEQDRIDRGDHEVGPEPVEAETDVADEADPGRRGNRRGRSQLGANYKAE